MSTKKYYCPSCQQYIGEEIGLATRSNLTADLKGFHIKEIVERAEYFCPLFGDTLDVDLGKEIMESIERRRHETK